MRRADEFYVEPVGVVPPVVEGRGGEHSHAAPASEEDAERTVQAEEADRGGAELRVLARRSADDKPEADDAAEHSAEVEQQVRGRPEGIAADGAVPGDVPLAADVRGGYGGHPGPQIPGDGRGL